MDTPETMIVRCSIPGIDAIESWLRAVEEDVLVDLVGVDADLGRASAGSTSAIPSSCSRVATPPVGFEGKLRKMSFVRGVIERLEVARRETLKPVSSRGGAAPGAPRRSGVNDS